METDGRVEKQSTVFPHVLAKRLGAFCTVPTGFTAVNPQTTKPDISFATKTGHFYLLPTVVFIGSARARDDCIADESKNNRYVLNLLYCGLQRGGRKRYHQIRAFRPDGIHNSVERRHIALRAAPLDRVIAAFHQARFVQAIDEAFLRFFGGMW